MNRVEQLHPWLQVLERHTKLPGWSGTSMLDDTLASGVVYLLYADPTPVPELCEALELLALLALDDYDEWLCALMSIWPLATAFWANAFYPKAFRLGIDVGVWRCGKLSQWAERAFLADPGLATADGDGDYGRMRGSLEASIGGAGKKREGMPEVPVCLLMKGSVLHPLSFLLFETVQLARTLSARRARAAPSRRWAPLFRLEMILLDVGESEMTTKTLVYQEEIISCGVLFDSLRFLCPDMIEQPTALQSVACLHRMIAAPAKFANKPVRTVEVCADSSRQMLDGIFAAVLQSNTVEELDVSAIEDNEAIRERLMYWLAACAFGHPRASTLANLTLRNIEMRDVEVLERTLRKGDAMLRLFRDAKTMEQDAYVIENVSTFALACPRADGPDPSRITVEVPFEKLRVISVAPEWVSVLLPGWGQAWVRRSGITLHRDSNTSCAAQSSIRPVRAFHLYCNSESVILRFLRVVGGSARALQIKDNQPLSANGVREVCLACPDLDELYLRVGTESLDVVEQCFADGSCRARRVDLKLVHETIHDTAPFSFFSWLGDDQHPFAQHLVELDLTIHTPQLSCQTLQLVSAAAEVLNRNQNISRLRIRFKIPDGNARDAAVATLAMFETAFLRHNGQPVAVEAAPLGSKQRVAMLSVLRSSHPLYGAAGSSMDAGVVSHIFAYAAYCKKRQVQVVVK